MKDELRILSGWLFLTIVMLGLVSCSQSSDCFQEDVLCAALVTDTQGIEDSAMSRDTWAGLEQAKSEGIVQRIEVIESIDSRDYEKNIAYFADLGFDVIFTIGAGMDDETIRAADRKPFDPAQGGVGTVFVGMNQPQSESRPNLVTVTFPEDQMGFVAGALAARISETQIVGAICETSGIDSMWRYCEGFRAGVAFTNELLGKNVKASVVYREDGDREKLFLDEAWGAETAQGLIKRGADVIFAVGGATGRGALQAAAEAGIQTIGSESGPGGVTSVLGDASSAVRQILQQEPLSPKIKYIPLDQTFPENLTREMDLLLSALQSGEIKVDVTQSKR
jgi:basic membrane lipoprotein Med (substrate-binding protein (PBP1-ABC) superfamily)